MGTPEGLCEYIHADPCQCYADNYHAFEGCDHTESQEMKGRRDVVDQGGIKHEIGISKPSGKISAPPRVEIAFPNTAGQFDDPHNLPNTFSHVYPVGGEQRADHKDRQQEDNGGVTEKRCVRTSILSLRKWLHLLLRTLLLVEYSKNRSPQQCL